MAKVSAPNPAINPLAQQLATTCWYTSYRMMWIWKNKTDPGDLTYSRDTGTLVFQGGGVIKDKLVAAGIDWDDACKTGLKCGSYLKAAKALGMSCLACGTGLSLFNLQEMLKTSPVWVAGKWRPANSHVVVAIAADETWINFVDPWPDAGTVGASTPKLAPNSFLYGDSKVDDDANVTKIGTAPGVYYQRGWYQFQGWK